MSERQLWAIVSTEPEERAPVIDAIGRVVARERSIVAVQQPQVDLCGVPPENVVVTRWPIQNAATLLECFLEVFRRDPSALVVTILAHDPVIGSDEFHAILGRARLAAQGCDNRAVLLGIPARQMDQTRRSGLLPVAENEDATWASLFLSDLDAADAPLRFASIFVASSSAFLRLYETGHPRLLRALLSSRTATGRALSEGALGMTVDPDLLVRASPVIKTLVAA